MKSLRSLRIPFIILVSLCLLLLLYYQLIYTKPGEPIETTSEGNYSLLSLPSNDIKSVTVEKKSGEGFTISSDEVQDSSIRWTFEAEDGILSDLTFSQVLLDTYVSSISNISSISEIDSSQASLSEYGLEEPDFVVNINMKSGQINQLHIGNYSIGKDSVYVNVNDSDQIYLVSANLRVWCEYSYIEFLETNLISVQYDEVLSFNFNRKTDPISVNMSPDLSSPTSDTTYNSWKFVSPLSFLASNKMSGFIESILELPINKFLSSDAMSEDYGLYDPEYLFSIIKTDGSVVEISLSKLIGDYYYGVTNLSPNIFMVSKSSISGLQTPLVELISPEFYPEDIFEIKSIEATFPDGYFLLEMDIEENEHFLSDQSKIYINKRNAKVSDSDGTGYFEVLYNSILNVQLAEVDFEKVPQNLKTVSLKILKKDGSLILVDYSIKDNESYYVFMNDIYLGFIVDNTEIYGKESANYSGYGIWDAYELLNNALDGQLNGKYDIPEP